jgi:hypothetical protein
MEVRNAPGSKTGFASTGHSTSDVDISDFTLYRRSECPPIVPAHNLTSLYRTVAYYTGLSLTATSIGLIWIVTLIDVCCIKRVPSRYLGAP